MFFHKRHIGRAKSRGGELLQKYTYITHITQEGEAVFNKKALRSKDREAIKSAQREVK